MEINPSILEEAFNIIRKEGVVNLNEQHLAFKLNITESAFYEIFQSKENLVRQVFQYEFKTRKQEHVRIFTGESNPVVRLLSVVKLGLDDLKKFEAPVLQQLREYHPEIWTEWWSQSNEYTHHLVHDLLNDGVLTGDLRRDLNLELVVKIMLEQLNMLVNPDVFPPDRYNTAEVFRSIFLYYIRGLCTEEGMKRANNFFASLR